MSTSLDDRLGLDAAAAALGVHYQTAYRWVRNGRLRAELVDGRYVVERRDAERLAERRRSPRRPPAPGRPRVDRAADRLFEALVAGDEPGARALCRRLVDEGASVAELIQDVLAPALARIGQRWHDGELTVWVEHRAAAVAERLLGELAPNPRGRRRGTVVVGAVSGDRHSLPTTMAAIALREDHWTVHHLGADLPADELVRFCSDHDVDVAVLSVTNPAVAEAAQRAARRLRSAGTAVVVGGPGRTLGELVEAVRDEHSRRRRNKSG